MQGQFLLCYGCELKLCNFQIIARAFVLTPFSGCIDSSLTAFRLDPLVFSKGPVQFGSLHKVAEENGVLTGRLYGLYYHLGFYRSLVFELVVKCET